MPLAGLALCACVLLPVPAQAQAYGSGAPQASDAPPGHAGGVIRTAQPEGDGLLLRVAARSGQTYILVPASFASASLVVDAEVTARGVWRDIPTGTRQTMHRVLHVARPSDVTVVTTAPVDPFAVDRVPLANAVPRGGSPPDGHRIKVAGTVTGQLPGRAVYVTDGTTHLRISTRQDTRVVPGDVIEIVGFLTDRSLCPCVVDAQFRRVGHQTPPVAVRIDPARLLIQEHDHALVRLEATLLRHSVDSSEEHKLVLRAGDVTLDAVVPAEVAATDVGSLVPGSRLEVTGLAELRRTGTEQPLSMTLWPRSTSDIRVVGHPSWWTPERSGFIMLTLLAGLVSATGWVAALRRRLPIVERQRRETEERYRELFQQAPAGHFVATADGMMVDCNRTFAQMLGFPSPALVLERTCESLCDDPAQHDALRARLSSGNAISSEPLTLRGYDGRVVPALVTAVARLDARGQVVEVQGFLVDRTEQERAAAQLRERDAQLFQSQKMEAIGRLAGGIAHDFNNRLTAIIGNAEFARDGAADRVEVVSCIDEVLRSAESAASLTQQLLTFSRKQDYQPTVVDLNDLLADLHKMLRRLVGEDVDLRLTPAEAPALVAGDRTHLEQVFVNLAVNSRDAMPRGGTLAIRVAGDASHVTVHVDDTGCGIDAETLPRIFEPFFTTKAPGRGTGLGLAMVYGAVTQSGGTVNVSSTPGEGTQFTITLPRVVHTTDGSPHPRSSSHRRDLRGTGTILLVEDETAVRTLTRHTLESAGYTVVEASTGADALPIARRLGFELDLLLTDVVMPGMSGIELARALRDDNPFLGVVLMSGYAEHPTLAHHAMPSDVVFLHKPFNRHTLLTAVGDVLESQEDASLSR
jgi:PAS domain S-box-containing protein